MALLFLAAVASAQDEFYETIWIVGEDGNLLGLPDPDARSDSWKPFRVFDSSPGACLEPMCWYARALLLAPGPSDLASLCDPERHLKKTNHFMFDECFLWGISSEWMAENRSIPGSRRRLLDILLGWRVLGSRGLKEGAPMLREMSKAEGLDPVTRLAAGDIAAMLDGRKSPAIDLPPLDRVPPDAAVLVVVDQRKIPPWRDPWRLHRTAALREARLVIDRIGAAVDAPDVCAAQWDMDRESEGFYELARRFGNARVHRAVLALRFPGDPEDLASANVFLRCEGLFDVDRFKDGCAASGVKPGEARGGAASARFGDVDVALSRDLLEVSRGYPAPADGGGIPGDLAKLGLGGDDAIFVHCRTVPFASGFIEGIESLTIRAKFDGGVTVQATGRFRDEASARKAATAVVLDTLDLKPAGFRDVNQAAVVRLKKFLESADLSVEGATVVARWTGPGETPESLFAGLVDLAAMYDLGEEAGKDDK